MAKKRVTEKSFDNGVGGKLGEDVSRWIVKTYGDIEIVSIVGGTCRDCILLKYKTCRGHEVKCGSYFRNGYPSAHYELKKESEKQIE